jgi:hypothetical protein
VTTKGEVMARPQGSQNRPIARRPPFCARGTQSAEVHCMDIASGGF